MSKNNFLLKTVIIFMAFVAMGDMIITPIAANIMESFPDMSTFAFNFIMSGAMLMSIPAALIGGKLAQHLSKKTLLVFAYGLYIVAGIGNYFVNSEVLFMICRGCVGISAGLLGACAFSLIAELFPDEKTCSSMIGYYNAFMSGCGIVISLLSGYLGTINWRFSFLINLFAILVLILIICFLPKTPPENTSYSEKGKNNEKMPFPATLGFIVFAVVFNALYCIIFYCISIYLAEINMGGSDIAGIISSLGTIGCAAAGLVFSFIFRCLKNKMPIVLFFVLAIGYFILTLPIGIVMIGAMNLLMGFAYGVNLSYVYMTATMIAPPSKMAFSSALGNASIGLGCFVSTYLLTFYQNIFHADTMQPVFLYVAITAAAATVITIIITVICKNKKTDEKGVL